MQQSGLAFHYNHDELFGATYSYDDRVAVIKFCKPIAEQKLRLRLFRVVSDELLPGQESVEFANYVKTMKTYYKFANWVTYWGAWVAYKEKYHEEITELHKKLCPDCPWDGKTIFTRRNDKGEWY